jgi:hypothetical protein
LVLQSYPVAPKLQFHSGQAAPGALFSVGHKTQELLGDQTTHQPLGIMEMPRNAGITAGMGALEGMLAEFEAERRLDLESQGIRVCGIAYPCSGPRVSEEMTVCVPKEMPAAEIEQKINAENRTGSAPWWKVSANTTLQSGKPHRCPCNHQPARLNYLLLIAVDAL